MWRDPLRCERKGVCGKGARTDPLQIDHPGTASTRVKSNWHRIYYLLGSFNVLSVAASVFIGHLLMGYYRDSVAENSEWAGRIANFQELGQIATQANGPGNDVFETKDVDTEEARFETLVVAFEERLQRTRGEVTAHLPPEQAARLSSELDAAARAFESMVQEARRIFSAFRNQQVDQAGAHMASMDRALGSTSEALGRLATEARAQQSSSLATQLSQATAMTRAEWVLVGLVLVMVGGIVVYGSKLASVFQAAAREIDSRNGDLKRVLDNVSQGLVTVELDGRIGGEHSAALIRLLGPVRSGDSLETWVRRVDPAAADSLAVGFPEVSLGILPLELLLDQLPKRIVHGEVTVQLEYLPVMSGDTLERILLVATDITPQLERERAEAEQLELVALFRIATADPSGLSDGIAELRRLADLLVSRKDLMELKRHLHTIKGNAGVMGARRLAALCHTVEDEISELGELTQERAESVRAAVEDTARRAAGLAGSHSDDLIVVEKSEVADLLEQVIHGNHRRVVDELATWSFDRAEVRLERLATLARGLAHRLGKEVEVVVGSGRARLPREYAGLWAALPHVLRNAVDHGIESHEERIAAAKAPRARVELNAVRERGCVVIEVTDDGRGIDWSAVRTKAAALGLATETEEDLAEALFADGLSTKNDISEVSGRGVGMAALRETAVGLGGTVRITSTRGAGTNVRIELPTARRSPRSIPPRAA